MPLGKRLEGRQRQARRTQFQELAPESKINMPQASGREGEVEKEGGSAQDEPEQWEGGSIPSGSVLQD